MYSLRSPHTTVHIYPPKLTIGRAMRDFVIPDVTISRQHAEIVWEQAGEVPQLVIKDQSRFGTTKLNGSEIPRDPITGERSAVLKPLDVLIFGACQDEFTVVADRMCFCVDKKTIEFQAFAEKTGHRVTCGFDPSATAFIHTSDNLNAADISPACLTSVVYGVPVISVEYVKQFAALKSGSTDSVLSIDRFRISDTKTRDKLLANVTITFAQPSAFEEAFRFAGASDMGRRLFYVDFQPHDIPTPDSPALEFYALSELDLIDQILKGSEISENFRVPYVEPNYEAPVSEEISESENSGWISTLPCQGGDEHCKVVPLQGVEGGVVAAKAWSGGRKRQVHEVDVEFTVWRSNNQGGNQNENKASFDDFFDNRKKRNLRF